MKKVFILLFIFFISCINKQYNYSNIKEDLFLDPYYFWVNSSSNYMFGGSSDVISATLRIINNRDYPVKVIVTCKYQPENILFGSLKVNVDSKSNKVFMIKGFSRGIKENIKCEIEKVERNE